MEYIWILFALLAAVAFSVMVINILPFSLDKKLNPLAMFLSAMIALVLPHFVVLALAMTVPMGLIYGWTGIRLQGHVPVKLPIEQAVNLVSKLRPKPEIEYQEILSREFPNPAGVEKYVPDL